MFRITFLLFFLPTLCISQITYTAGHYFQPGDTMIYSSSAGANDPFNFTETGANFTWDYSNLTFDNQSVDRYDSPASNAYQFPWCLLNGFIFGCTDQFAMVTNLSTKLTDTIEFGGVGTSDITQHLLINEQSLQATILGITASLNGTNVPAPFDYEKPDTLIHFPIQYLNADISNSRVVLDGNPVGFNIKLSLNSVRENQIEGYGSLMTPFGEFEDVLKMKSTIYNSDTTFLDTTTIPIQRTTIEYTWYDSNFPGPVLIVNGVVVNGQENILNVRYMDIDRDSTTAVNYSEISEEIKLFPNPVRDVLNISLSESQINEVAIHDFYGKLLFQKEANDSFLKIPFLYPAGIYFLKIQNSNQQIKWIKVIATDN